ncbi:hypothetical protein DPMN_101450 [Dreissena polymorpha]|uniref:Uncharacterized protein n=1 Tax=Dreissena polymorpha TaxID=45954 RepID=A0A9D4R9Q7_DREPO|nr:hypothetical protein DPMN_101450 [Dreissena polymorpha]
MAKRNIGVGVQWPQQIREARKALHPLAKEAESRREKTRMVGNKLFINNELRHKYVNGNVINIRQ